MITAQQRKWYNWFGRHKFWTVWAIALLVSFSINSYEFGYLLGLAFGIWWIWWFIFRFGKDKKWDAEMKALQDKQNEKI